MLGGAMVGESGGEAGEGKVEGGKLVIMAVRSYMENVAAPEAKQCDACTPPG